MQFGSFNSPNIPRVFAIIQKCNSNLWPRFDFLDLLDSGLKQKTQSCKQSWVIMTCGRCFTMHQHAPTNPMVPASSASPLQFWPQKKPESPGSFVSSPVLAGGYFHHEAIYYHYYIYMYIYIWAPVVPHKAAAEVSEKETYRRRWLLWVTDGRANPLIDRKVVGGSRVCWSGCNGCRGHLTHNCWM